MEASRLGVELEELQLPAYTTATATPDPSHICDLHHSSVLGNAGSSTHCERPGIKHTSSWILVGFVTTEPQWELQNEYSLELRISSRRCQRGCVVITISFPPFFFLLYSFFNFNFWAYSYFLIILLPFKFSPLCFSASFLSSPFSLSSAFMNCCFLIKYPRKIKFNVFFFKS